MISKTTVGKGLTLRSADVRYCHHSNLEVVVVKTNMVAVMEATAETRANMEIVTEEVMALASQTDREMRETSIAKVVILAEAGAMPQEGTRTDSMTVHLSRKESNTTISKDHLIIKIITIIKRTPIIKTLTTRLQTGTDNQDSPRDTMTPISISRDPPTNPKEAKSSTSPISTDT